MSPALVLAWSVVGLSALSFALSEVLPILRATVRVLSLLSPTLARLAAIVVTAVLLVGMVRPSRVVAVTPPPSERIVLTTNDPGEVSASLVSWPGRFLFSSSSGPTAYTVVAGDSLWAIARERLAQSGVVPSGSEVSVFWRSIYEANTTVIGPDPDLILPGQVLAIPGGTHG
ncbi:MAG: LysM peptidoglycan-binding domain-containing protein [Actinomycetia bacterium]|nr:LysM peptidoglycan-binding domain-containing protein [Actinomycetes bacterium]